MDNPIEIYWLKRLTYLQHKLEENNFDVFLANDGADAKNIVMNTIIPALDIKTISWGGSMTFTDSGLYKEILEATGDYEILNVFDKKKSNEEINEIRRKSLISDLFITGTNAITEEGQLVNLDMIGNRVAAISFGPKNVIILAGRNKIVSDIYEGMDRIKNYAAPTNVMRLKKKTPCLKTSICEDCKSPDRICNAWSIHEKSFPKKRIKVILINQSMGL